MRPSEKWRWIVAADILIHMCAIWWFALLPPSTLMKTEIFVMALTMFAAAGVFSHVHSKLKLPGDQWSYAASGFVGLFTLLTYEVRSYGEVQASIAIPFGLFLFAGVVSSFAAHVIDGGPNRRLSRGR